jgi:hypothetical protein
MDTHARTLVNKFYFVCLDARAAARARRRFFFFSLVALGHITVILNHVVEFGAFETRVMRIASIFCASYRHTFSPTRIAERITMSGSVAVPRISGYMDSP